MVKVKKPRAARTTLHYHETHQNTDRIARATYNVAICGTFSRSILLLVIAYQPTVSPASESIDRIDRLVMSPFAGLSPPW